MGDKMSWDEYREEHHIIADAALGEAFAAYLHYLSDGAWDGEVFRVDPVDPVTSEPVVDGDEPEVF